jgi:hypothetical protein
MTRNRARRQWKASNAALRQAIERALALRLTDKQWAVFANVLRQLAGWSLAGEAVSHEQLADGVSERTVSRTLPILADAHVIGYRAGDGRGRLSWIELPSAVLKGGQIAGDLSDGKGRQIEQERSPSPARKVATHVGDTQYIPKRNPTRARDGSCRLGVADCQNGFHLDENAIAHRCPCNPAP